MAAAAGAVAVGAGTGAAAEAAGAGAGAGAAGAACLVWDANHSSGLIVPPRIACMRSTEHQ